jgi:hypothetical protein
VVQVSSVGEGDVDQEPAVPVPTLHAHGDNLETERLAQESSINYGHLEADTE